MIVRTQTLPSPVNADAGTLYLETNTDGKILRRVLKDFRRRPFFNMTPANLGDGHLGYAASGYDMLSGGFDVDAGGNSGYSALGAVSEKFSSMTSSIFNRVGTYTFPNGKGLAADSNNLYILEDIGTQARVRGFNQSDGSITFTSQNHLIGSSSVLTALAVIGNFAYFANSGFQGFRRVNLTTGAIDTGLGQSASTTPRSAAAVNNIIYFTGHARRLFSWNLSNNVVSRVGSISWSIMMDSFASINGVLYGVGSDGILYTINLSNASLTSVGQIAPANTDFIGLASIGSSLYGFHDTDNGIYQSEGQGNRWAVIFPNSTTEVSDSDTTLKLFPEPNGNEVELARQSDITTAIVFASDSDGATAHTLVAGTAESIALYKSDDTPLFQGAVEAIYSELRAA